MTDTLH